MSLQDTKLVHLYDASLDEVSLKAIFWVGARRIAVTVSQSGDKIDQDLAKRLRDHVATALTKVLLDPERELL